MIGFQPGAFQSPGFQQAPAAPATVLPRHARATLALAGLPRGAIAVPGRPAAAASVPSRPTADLEV